LARTRDPDSTIPVAGLSAYDPIHFGIDENGHHVTVTLMYRNLLCGGEPGSGKSSLLNTIIGHVALCPDAELWLFDGKRVELGLWRQIARVFVGNTMRDGITGLRELQSEMDIRYLQLEAVGRRKILATDLLPVIFCVIDELAYFTAVAGTDAEQHEIETLIRDLVARGRAVGIIVIAATQRPSAEIVPTKLRDLFGYRAAFRCTTDSSSDIILANGWAGDGYSARTIPPESIGVGYLLAEGGIPRRFKAASLDDAHITALVSYAAMIRSHNGPAA
jgi:S-DNA-T family DNA segregation ATPase FtsK/SpoIIIE